MYMTTFTGNRIDKLNMTKINYEECSILLIIFNIISHFDFKYTINIYIYYIHVGN